MEKVAAEQRNEIMEANKDVLLAQLVPARMDEHSVRVPLQINPAEPQRDLGFINVEALIKFCSPTNKNK